MLLRARMPDGSTLRVALEPGATPGDLQAKIAALGRLSGPFALRVGPALGAPPFDLARASHGDMVYVAGTLIVDVDEEAAAAERSAAKAAAVAAAAKERAEAKERARATETQKMNAVGAQTPGGDGAGPSSASPAEPASAQEEEKKSSSASETNHAAANSADAAAWRPRCLHGPRGMCEHCMPTEDKKSRYERELAKWKGKGMSIGVMEALEALKFRVKLQETAHISAAAVDNAAASEFQSYLAKTSFSQQRLGICYGRFDPVERETQVRAIYEPPQHGSESTYEMLQGDDSGDISERATKLANALDLDCVGLVISARPRKCILSAKDVVVASKMISALSPEARKAFVVLLVSLTESGETAFEAYQLSDQAVEMYEGNIFAPEQDQKPNGGRVITKEKVFVEGKETDKVHTEFFLLNIPIKSMDGGLRTSFPVENRELHPQSPADVRRAVDPSSGLPYGKRLADFHLLLFLSSFLDIETDIPLIADRVKVGSNDIDEGYRLLIESMA